MKTVNRTPYTVKELNYDDVNYKYFNYTEWKGMCNDKNFIGVDQETFADCKNVYIDESGLLRSRPSIKLLSTSGINDVVDVWTFDIITAYKIGVEDDYRLVFVKDGQITDNEISVPNKFVLVLADEKIFMFAADQIAYLDLKTLVWYDSNSSDEENRNEAISKIYVPVLSVDESDVNTKVDDVNELTTSAYKSYHYDNPNDINISLFLNSEVEIKINDVSYSTVFTTSTQLVLVNPTYYVYSNDTSIKLGSVDVPLIEIARTTDKLISILTYASGSSSSRTFRIYKSVDLIVFELFDTRSNALYKPMLAKNGEFVAVLVQENKRLACYAKSILSTEEGGTNKFPSWTNLLASHAPIDVFGTTLLGASFQDDQCYSIAYGTDVNYKQHSSYINPAINGVTYQIGVVTYYDGKFTDKIIDSEAKDDYQYVSNEYQTFSERQIGRNMIDDNSDYYFPKGTLTDQFGNKVDINMHGGVSFDYYSSHLRITIDSFTLTFYDKDGNETSVDKINERITVTEQLTDGYRDFITKEVTWRGGAGGQYGAYGGSVRFNIRVYSDGYINANTYASCAVMINTYGYSKKSNKTAFANAPINLDVEETNGSSLLFFNGYVNSTVRSKMAYGVTKLSTKQLLNEYTNSDTSSTAMSACIIHGLLNFYLYYTSSDNKVNKLSVDKGFVLDAVKDTLDIVSNGIIKAYNDDIGNECILTTNQLQDNETKASLIAGTSNIPLYVGPRTIVYYDKYDEGGAIYTNISFNAGLYINALEKGQIKIPNIDFVTKLENYYFAVGNKLLISSTPANVNVGEFKWYLPSINTEPFDYSITAMQPISMTEVALFFEHAIYYVSRTEYGYVYNKSRIPLGCKYGSDVITTYDGKYTIFSTQRGLVAMSYQDFISSTEQALTFLSDNIFDKYDKWNTTAIKIVAYKFWLIIYRTDDKEAFVFDLRNNSWWPISIRREVAKVYSIDNALYLIMNKSINYVDASDEKYADDNGIIEWYLVTQKLHLNAVNYYKHVVNLTLNSVLDSTNENVFNLDIVTYSNQVRYNTGKSIKYVVDMINTFVKRLNHAKVQEFQFILSSNKDAIQTPLSLTNISIKYLITGQVR